MKKSIVIFLTVLLVSLTITLFSFKNSEYFKTKPAIQHKSFLHLQSRIKSLLKKGYYLDLNLSTDNILCYKLNDTTTFINQRNILNSSNISDARYYIMNPDTDISSGELYTASNSIVDDGKNFCTDLAINMEASGIDQINFWGSTSVCFPPSPGLYYVTPTGSGATELVVWSSESYVFEWLDAATEADPTGESFQKK